MGTKNPERSKALNASYSEAQAWLVEQHKDEFNTKRAAILKAKGIEWAPPLTQEEKDRAALDEILARNPDLAQRVTVRPEPVQGAGEPKVDPHS